MPNKKYDVVIIGSGGAGCSAAIEAWKKTKNIIILTKSAKQISKTANAQGGLQASFLEDDSPELHFKDTMDAGNNKSNPKLVKILTQSARDTVFWLEKIGVDFDRTESGYALKKAAGISKNRVLSCGDDTGNKIINPILNTVKQLGIPLLENCGVSSIEKKDNQFFLNISETTNRQILAKTVVIATGGLMPREKRLGLKQSASSVMPDGIELAHQLGAECKNADLTQYHPTGIIEPATLRRERFPETMRGAGARLLNNKLEEFVDPLITRNKLSDAIVDECEKGNGIVTVDGRQGVWLTTQEIDENNGDGYTQKTFPKFYNLLLEHGHNITEKAVLVYPIVHYSLGGIVINQNTETNISNLYAAGETTWGVHGEERLMGNSLLDIFVFGRIAGKNAAEAAISYE